jgi:TonB-linked SusC/RagA family outer membrane protein
MKKSRLKNEADLVLSFCTPNLLPLKSMMAVIIIALQSFQLQAADTAIDKISIAYETAPLKKVLKEIEKQSEFRFFYNHQQVNVKRTVTVHFQDVSLTAALKEIFKGTPVNFKISGRQILLYEHSPQAGSVDTGETVVSTPLLQNTEVNISGIVTDDQGDTMPGVNIVIKGTTLGTVTDSGGKFVLNVPNEHANGTLIFSFIGYTSQEVPINGRTTIDVMLVTDLQTLSEVMVVGVSMKEKDLTGAVVNVEEATIKERPVTSINEALQGRAAGVRVTTSAEPGANASIKVRGNNSMQYGASPIYVVDGIVMERDFNMINPNDVASINILKDAASTALYGSRGANGVIIITTKKGRGGAGKISYDGWYGVQEFMNEDLTLGARDIYNLRTEAYENAGMIPEFADYELSTYNSGKSYNWLDEVTRSAVQQNHSLSFSGGTDKGSYYLSFGYTDQQGIMKSSGYKRYTGRINAEQLLQPWLKIGTNTSFTRSEEDLVDGKAFEVARGANPLLPISRYRDTLFLAWGNQWDINQENPLKTLTIDKDRTKNRIFSSTYLNVNPIQGLNFRSTFTVDFIDQEYYEYIPIETQQSIRGNFRGKAVHNFDHVFNFQWDNSVSYEKQFNKHLVSGLLSMNVSRNRFRWTNVGATSFPTDDFGYYNLGAAYDKTQFTVGSDITTSSLMSYVGRVNYEYDGRYLATVTARYDGSSKFADGQKWGLFPSIALAWNITGESFMDGQQFLDLAKFRVGYGSVGNQSIPEYSYHSLYYPQYSGGTVGFVSTGLRGTDRLTWESQKQLNIGLDLGMFNNRVQLSANYFNIVNSNLLMRRTLSPLTGYKESIENIGEMTNKGFELSANALILDTRGIKWTITANISADKNKVTKLYGDVDAIYAFGGFTGTDIQREGNFFLNQSINTIYMWEFDRIIQQEDMEYVDGLALPGKTLEPGDILPKDQQAEGEEGHGIIDEDDRVIVGKKDPKFYGGFSSQVSWNGISLNAVFTYSQGAKAVSWYYERLMSGTGTTAAHTDMLDRWTPDHTNTNVPRADYIGSDRFGAGDTSWGIQDASFLRLASLTLAYDLPASLVSRIRLTNFRVYTTGNNLATWTKYKGYDPENGDGYPTARMFVVGVNLGF